MANAYLACHASLLVQATWILALLIAAPAAAAGSAEDPEIRDDPGDVRWSPLPLSPEPVQLPTSHAAVFDILASWFHGETAEAIQVTMKVVDLSAVDDFGPPGVGFARWGTRFELSSYEPDTRDNWWNYTWIASVAMNNGPSGWYGSIHPPDAAGVRGEPIAAEFKVDGSAGTLTVHLPRKALGSPMAGDRIFDTLSLHDGQLGGIDFRDQSPDGTYPSRDYVFLMDTGASEPNQAPSEPGQEKSSPTPVGLLVIALVGMALRRP